MNILAATAEEGVKNNIYNVAVGDRTTLNDLFNTIKSALNDNGVRVNQKPSYRDFREGDVRHSQADVTKAIVSLGYAPKFKIIDGINKAMPWYCGFEEN